MKIDFNLRARAKQILARMTQRMSGRSMPAKAALPSKIAYDAPQGDEWTPSEAQVREAARSVWGAQVAKLDDAHLVAYVIEAGCASEIGLTDDYFKRPGNPAIRQQFAKAMRATTIN